MILIKVTSLWHLVSSKQVHRTTLTTGLEIGINSIGFNMIPVASQQYNVKMSLYRHEAVKIMRVVSFIDPNALAHVKLIFRI